MLLDLIFGKKEEGGADRIFADKVYISFEAKMRACAELAKANPNILFIAWFSDTAWKFKKFFLENGLENSSITEAHLVHPAQLQTHQPAFAEHYPLHAKEMALAENWTQKNIPVFSAMDEPLFKHFGSDKMIPLVKLLGIKENDAIEHSYVTESIVKGQKKIADKVIAEQFANSQAEWMERNLS